MKIIRTIYLYLFTIIGLILLVIGGTGLIDMGLKMFVFTKADREQQLYRAQPTMPYTVVRIEKAQEDEGFSEEEKESIKQWLNDYEVWKKENEEFNYIESERQEDASRNLAFILIGLPLYLFHWKIIKRELKNREEA